MLQEQAIAGKDEPLPALARAKGISLARQEQIDLILMRLNALRATNVDEKIVIGLTSCDRRAGVSTIAGNLAVRAAKTSNARVLLIDAHLDQPKQAANFQIRSKPGLAELAAGMAELEQVVVPTKIENLSLIPGGGRVNRRKIGLNPEVVEAFMSELRSEFPTIICDLPIVENSLRALAVAGATDGVIMVANGQRTRAANAASAVQILNDNSIPVAATVLNRVTPVLPRILNRWFSS